jgi:hypothetical protein
MDMIVSAACRFMQAVTSTVLYRVPMICFDVLNKECLNSVTFFLENAWMVLAHPGGASCQLNLQLIVDELNNVLWQESVYQ